VSAILQKLRNVSSNYLAAIVHGLIIILLTPFVVHELGTPLYAVWVIVQTIGYYLGFLDLGVVDAQVQRHSVLAARNQSASLGELHGTVLVLFLGAGIVACVLATVVSVLPSAALLDIPPDARDLYAWVLRLIGLAVLLSFVEAAANGIFEGHQRYDLMNAVGIVVAVLGAIASFAVLYAGYGLLGLAVVRVAESALGAAGKWLTVRRVFPPSSFPKLGFDRASWRSIRSFSLWNSLNDIVTEGTAQLDKLLIPILLASALVTPYSLIVTVAALVFVVAEPITETLLPLAASRHGKGDTVSLGVVLERGSKLVNTVTLPTTIVLLCFGTAILDLWIGAEYTNADPRVLWFTVLSFFLSTYFWSALAVLMGSGLVKRIFWTSVLEVAIVLALILALTPRLGLAGLALAGLIGNALIGFAYFVAGACALARLKLAPYLWRTMGRPVIGGLPALIVGIWLAGNVDLDGWIGAAACVAATGLCGVVGVAWTTMSRWERARYAAAVRRVLAPTPARGRGWRGG
jgi:O-antigen/teichoic acid export membrane protein